MRQELVSRHIDLKKTRYLRIYSKTLTYCLIIHKLAFLCYRSRHDNTGQKNSFYYSITDIYGKAYSYERPHKTVSYPSHVDK